MSGSAADPETVRKVLVAYASKHGATAEIADAIAEKLREYGLSVDCLSTREVTSLESYGAVVLGSALYLTRWRGDAKRFLRKHATELSERPFWLFSSGPVGNGQVDPDLLEPKRIIDEAQRLGVRDHVVFGGRVPTQPHGPIEHLLVRRTPRGYQDERPWAEIRWWAAGIADDLTTRRLGPSTHVRPGPRKGRPVP
jgi:menaquinone-dependent protoporphyrinogen oxidase